ncbi:MAG: hypothetical protein CEN91_298 [Candidatus Berkelbacteria bacterium Licking1014_85]|uniref:SHSP domain-containing protein n=1 Tax=Candidatus Berkelbacteria bacterium Licking1014_85 TaxID=2017148 RepID=A0A554LJS9_9BACT|nr:MAG: hypothetical protein CEN91_298 [Candidatus Berkelbacteria bacterium Licking1014_85]
MSENQTDWLDKVAEDAEEVIEGQLAIDVHQTEDDVIVKAPLAGVDPKDLEIGITDDVVTIRGHRKSNDTIASENYYTQECYWGAFSRTYILPIKVDPDAGKAELKNGILTITIPKLEKTKTKYIKVNSEE